MVECSESTIAMVELHWNALHWKPIKKCFTQATVLDADFVCFFDDDDVIKTERHTSALVNTERCGVAEWNNPMLPWCGNAGGGRALPPPALHCIACGAATCPVRDQQSKIKAIAR
jgi:hypothetical protein